MSRIDQGRLSTEQAAGNIANSRLRRRNVAIATAVASGVAFGAETGLLAVSGHLLPSSDGTVLNSLKYVSEAGFLLNSVTYSLLAKKYANSASAWNFVANEKANPPMS